MIQLLLEGISLMKDIKEVSKQQEVRVSQLFNILLFTQQEEEQEVRVSQLFNTVLHSARRRTTTSESKSIIH